MMETSIWSTKLIAIILSLAIVLIAGASARDNDDPLCEEGYKQVVDHTLPWLVSVSVKKDQLSYYCPGVFISPQAVLTSRICMWKYGKPFTREVMVFFNSTRFLGNPRYLRTRGLRSNPKTSFVVLQLSQPVPEEHVICLTSLTRKEFENTEVYQLAWSTADEPSDDGILYGSLYCEKFTTPLKQDSESGSCASEKSSDPDAICIMGGSQKSKVCESDSGSLVVKKFKNWCLVGFVPEVDFSSPICIREKQLTHFHRLTAQDLKEISDLDKCAVGHNPLPERDDVEYPLPPRAFV